MNVTDTVRLKETITPIAQKYGIERVLLFGSMARNEAVDSSDYDFLITKGKLRSLVQYMAFVDELEAVLERHVDVVTDSSSDEMIITNARQEGILLYER